MKGTILLLLILSLVFNLEQDYHEKILSQLTTLDGEIEKYELCGDLNDPVILVLTQFCNSRDKGSIYNSKDKGLRWVKMANTFFTLAQNELRYDEEIVGNVQNIIMSPVDKHLVIFQGTHGINWKSDNCGRDVVAMNQGKPIHEIVLHHTERNWLLATAWEECDDEYDVDYESCLINRQLFFSKNLGEEWELLASNVYEFMWAKLFLHIKHLGPNSRFGNLYVSDSTGTRLTLSEMHTAIDEDGNVDFKKIKSLEAVYVTNIYDESFIQKSLNTEIKKSNGKAYQLEDYRQSLITFDKGGQWQPITPPLLDSEQKPYACKKPPCSLHLHMSTTSHLFGPVHAPERAIGHILACGNVGNHLSQKKVNAFLSTDGGHSWKEIAKGSHIYEISDHGNIIIMAKDQISTNNILFSIDDGMTFHEYIFSETEFEVVDIFEISMSRFLIWGRDSSGRGMVLGLDTEKLFTRKCTGEPDKADSDYEKWIIPNEGCVLGQKFSYKKKKSSAECLNGEEFDRLMSVNSCTCTEADWECDLGFKRENGACVRMKKKDGSNLELKVPEICEDYYTISNGYRKIAGDQCKKGVQHNNIVIPCPNNQNYKTLILFLLIFVLVVVIYTLNVTNRLGWLKKGWSSVDDQNLVVKKAQDDEDHEFNPRN